MRVRKLMRVSALELAEPGVQRFGISDTTAKGRLGPVRRRGSLSKSGNLPTRLSSPVFDFDAPVRLRLTQPR